MTADLVAEERAAAERRAFDDRDRAILAEVLQEQRRQVSKWRVQRHPAHVPHTLADHVAELAKGRTDRAARAGRLTWRLILDEEVAEAYAERDPAELRAELIQVAAVAASWVRDLDLTAEEQAR